MTVCQDKPIIQVAVKVDIHLEKMDNQFFDQFGEYQRSQRKGEGASSELGNMISPNKAQPFPVRAKGQDMEVCIFEIDGGGPIVRSDGSPDGQGSLHQVTDPLQAATE